MRGEPSVSIVIEWDNVRLVNAPRAVMMLEALLKQLIDLGRPCEVILVHDPGELSSEELTRAIEDTGFGSAGIDVRTAQVSGEHYYELKNVGVDLARAPVVVFVDSDVVPEPGWLRALLEPFDSTDVDVVGGETYAGPIDTAYTKAFALFWFFPLRSKEATPRPQKACWANNCAFRREVVVAHKWPRARFIRYQNVLFFRDLVRDGVRIWAAPAARVEHPIPRGAQFFRYALSDGHDAAVRVLERRAPMRGALALLYLAVMVPARLARYLGSIAPPARRAAVGLRGAELPVAVGVAAAYAFACWVGFAGTVLAPRLVRRMSV